MIIKRFKLKQEILHFGRYKEELKQRGWNAEVNHENTILTPIIWKKLFSTWFTVFFVKKIILTIRNRKLELDFKPHHWNLGIALVSYIGLCTKLALTEQKDFMSLVFVFCILFLIASLIIFVAIRSEIIQDMKNSIIKYQSS